MVGIDRRICIFCETWESGGIESFLCNTLVHMDLTGLDIDLVVERLGESVFSQKLLDAGVNIIELSGSTRKLRQNDRMFRRLLTERRYDVLHLNIFQGMSLYYARLAKQAGVPVRIAHSHGAYLRESLTRPIKLWLHGTCRDMFASYATSLWACSSVAASFMFPRKILRNTGYRLIKNGIETERFRFASQTRDKIRGELGLSDELLIGHVGRLQNQKNQSFLLEVFAETVKKRSDVKLLLVGDGEDLGMLEAKAKALSIIDKVVFYGASNRVEELMQAMDVFGFPSNYEGLGIVVIEAQASGLPVLCAECVPEEADLTDLFHRLPLDAGAVKWAEELLKLGRDSNSQDRTGYADAVREKHFDIRDVAREVETCYRR